ncbi:MAG: OmpH family outer membrane protein [Candidatus Glassbacteria bacterium]
MRILSILMAIGLCLASMATAQEIKIGFVQVERLAQNFPELDDANKTYEKEVQSWQSQVQDYEKQISTLEEEFEQRAMLFSPEKKREKQDEILNKRQEATKFYQDIFAQGGKAEQRRFELLTPIYDKINRAIEILGKRDNYTMIFNAQGLLYAKQELDLTDEVVKILKAGVEVTPAGGTPKR